MCGTEGYSGVYGRLKRLLVAGQRTILVPQAGYNSSPGCCNTAIQEELDRLYQLSLSDPTVVAVVPFIWETVPGNWASGLDNYVGTAMETSYTTIGAQVKSGFTYPAGVQPVIQFVQPPFHFNSLSISEGLNAAFIFQGIGFNTYTSEISGTEPLYRCRDASTSAHFASLSSTCEGQTVEGLYGYVAVSQVGGTSPLYRFYNPSTDDFLCTTDCAEGSGASGYEYQGVLGYAPGVAIAE